MQVKRWLSPGFTAKNAGGHVVSMNKNKKKNQDGHANVT